ncbi:MAG: hypothetical protein MJK04_37875 [Psychrosphaera sp.]|nr:hypothetical protein [Psychrosphaera sp.]
MGNKKNYLSIVLVLMGLLVGQTSAATKTVKFSELLGLAKNAGIGITVTGNYLDVDVLAIGGNKSTNATKPTKAQLVKAIEKYNDSYLKTVESDGSVHFYLLPKGVSQAKFKASLATVTKPTQKPFTDFAKTPLIESAQIKNLPALQLLAQFSSAEKSKVIHIQRTVNPATSPAVYAFNAQWIEPLGGIYPTDMLGHKVSKGGMESFLTATDIYHFITSKPKWWYATQGDKTYLTTDVQGRTGQYVFTQLPDGDLVIHAQATMPNGAAIDYQFTQYTNGDALSRIELTVKNKPVVFIDHAS